MRVPRIVTEQLVRELDPVGVQKRKAYHLKRETYQNAGANRSWHCDGYDKLKPYGFCNAWLHRRWSRKILWLYVTRLNNLPSNEQHIIWKQLKSTKAVHLVLEIWSLLILIRKTELWLGYMHSFEMNQAALSICAIAAESNSRRLVIISS